MSIFRLISPIVCLCLSSVSLAGSDSVSYVVIQDREPGLLRIAENGSVRKVAGDVQGIGLAIDPNGNYVVTTGASLVRVSRTGTVSAFATAPAGAHWIAIAIDPAGNVIAADEPAHRIWRISPDGEIINVAQYPGSFPIGGSDLGIVVDSNGDYIVMRISDDNAPRLYRVHPDGNVSPLHLTGAVAQPTRRFRVPKDGPVAVSGGPLVSDGSGGYYFLDDHSTQNIFSLGAAGNVTKFATLACATRSPTGLARNKLTGELIIGERSGILKVSASGSVSRLPLAGHFSLSIAGVVVDYGVEQTGQPVPTLWF